MIIIAIFVLILGNFAPKWILKRKYIEFRNGFSWKSSFLKLSGMTFCMLLALVMTIGVTLTSKQEFVLNKNAVYGLEFSDELKAIGFEDGDRITLINGIEVDRVSEIILQILNSNTDGKVDIIRNDIHKTLLIDIDDLYSIINSKRLDHVNAKMYVDSTIENKYKKVEISTSRYSLLNAFENFNHSLKYVLKLIIPQANENNEIGGFRTITKETNVRGYLMILTLSLIFVSILNFIPLPGFNFGEFIISASENLRKTLYSNRLMTLTRIISVSFVIIVIFLCTMT